ncbi:peptidase S49 [Shewanella mangrovi]|uniref:Peptidase S49 n=1 Tax=Shewanella mangrovi TaxID=1515746 RepID=A0A094JDI0_9GAMM|nr:protease SohB [Shewanella mangrovi]KFZ37955.1 peptidase S49 [Shewanella mangrovi]
MEFLYEYGLFLAKAVTLVVAIAVVVAIVVSSAVKPKAEKGELHLSDLSDELSSLKHHLNAELLDKKAFKQYEKQQKAAEKAKAKETDDNVSRVFVMDFKGGIEAAEVASLRREISAVLAVANSHDEVVVNVESGGGMVHGYGLAASQLERFRAANIPLTVCVDKVAASGGYMMACVANKIVAAPFAIIGSIGVVAQLPNFNRLLRKHDIDYEQHTAGEFKRTITMFGENTEEGREKFREELEETHHLFKDFVGRYRPELAIDKVATGEHWYGQQALDLGLIDQIGTSDDLLMSLANERQVFKVQYQIKKKLADKIGHGASVLLHACIDTLTSRNRAV